MAKNSGKWAVGTLLAGVAGFVTGILTAPKSGKETRKDIKNTALKAKAEAEKELKSMHSQLNTALDKAKTESEKVSAKAKVEYEKAVVKAKSAKEKIRDLLSSLHDGDADDPDLKKALQEAKDALKSIEKFIKKPSTK